MPATLPAQTPTRPEWGDAKAVNRHFGLSRSTLHRLATSGKIRSSSLRERGKSKGKKLYSMDSIAEYIDSHASGGTTPTEAAP